MVADAFEAMTSDRPYRPRRPVDEALAELERHSGTQFDPACITALRRILLPVSTPGRALSAAA
jgi:HD-GYP domain-containing protein (c-di-GMP phosphodiesterase class II)